MTKHLVDWRFLAVGLAVSAVFAFAVATVLQVGFWVIFAAAVGALLANAALAALEDRAEGGYLNPNGKATPRWLAFGLLLARMSGLLLLAAVAAILVIGWSGTDTNQMILRASLVGTSVLLGAAAILRKHARPIVWSAIATLFVGFGWWIIAR